MVQNNYTIINGRVIDPFQKLDGKYNIVIGDGKICHCEPSVSGGGRGNLLNFRGLLRRFTPRNDNVIDASNLIITPGFINIHAHLREPGLEYKEDIESGSKAAAAGGFTTIFCMPNTNPAIHNIEIVDLIRKRAKQVSPIKINPIGAITKDIAGLELSNMSELAKAGVIAFSDDGHCVSSYELMKKALMLAKKLNVLIIDHPEDKSATGQDAENNMIERDIKLAKETAARIHIAHVSTAKGIEMIRRAKQQGTNITCEATPHHLLLTEDDIIDANPNMKMSPPLRTKNDRSALVQGLVDGTIDCIADDHAPHAVHEKIDFAKAAAGVIGMETTFSACMKLVHERKITLGRLIELFTSGPAKVIGLNIGRLEIGRSADITIVDPNRPVTIDASKFQSKARNCPFDGWQLKGRIIYTIAEGRIVFK